MSGTRKMEKFELEALTKAHVEERAAKASQEGAPSAKEAAQEPAQESPAQPTAHPPESSDLPARPFEPRVSDLRAEPRDGQSQGALPLPAPPLVQPTHELSGPKPARPAKPPVPSAPSAPRVPAAPPKSGAGAWHEASFAASAKPPTNDLPDAGMPVVDLPPPAVEVPTPAAEFPPVDPFMEPTVRMGSLGSLGDESPYAGATVPLPQLPQEPAAVPPAPPSSGRAVSVPPGQPFVPGEWIPPQAEEEAPGEKNEADPDALRTRLARKFVTLADSVTEAFKTFSLGAGGWTVELTAPQGMSTGGGKQALQHVRLIPRRPGYSVLVAGAVNQVERRAELRDFDHVAIMHEVRFRHSLEVNRQEWEDFLRKAETVLNAAGIQSMRTPPPRDLLEQRRSMQRVSKGAVIALVVVLLLATIVVWRVIVAVTAQAPLE